VCNFCDYETEDSFRIKNEIGCECESFLVDDFYPAVKFKQVEEMEDPEFKNEDESESDGF
jgi:hypothetical protein